MLKLIFITMMIIIITPKLPKLIQFIYWKIKDITKAIKEGKKLHYYGIDCFVGIYGGGKTISLVEYLEQIRKKHGNKVLIATNFGYTNEDFTIETWQDLLQERDKPIIFGYDELQNEFNSREYSNFPVQLMHLLTQNRKGHGKQILYTTQDYETVDKNFRRLTRYVYECRTILGRYTRHKKYLRLDFEKLISTPDVNIRRKIRPMRKYSFIQTDKLRDLFNSYKMLDIAKKKQYLGLHDLQAKDTLNNLNW